MSTQIVAARRHVKTYHHHHHLLVQFIWSELILADQHTFQAMLALKSLNTTLNGNDNAPHIHILNSHVTKLSGSAHDYMRLFAWGEDGILAKLKNYCCLFTQDKIGTGKEQLNMTNQANKAWLLSLQAQDQVRLLSQHNSAFDKEAFATTLSKVHRCITQLKKMIAQVSVEFRSDENVLLFILRHQELLDGLHQKGFVKKLLDEMHPKGVQEAGRILIKKYKLRGFTQFLPFIRMKIEKLQS